MATTWTINNSTAALAPYSIVWNKIQAGTDHNGAPIFSAYKEVELRFESASITFAREWLNTENGAAHTFDILGELSLGFITLSNIYVAVEQYPVVESVIAGPFTLKLLKVKV